MSAPGVSAGQVIIQPTSLAENSVDPDTGSAQFNIILVGGGTSSITGVTISNLVVDGSLLPADFFWPSGFICVEYEGILFLNAGGIVTGNTVQNVYLSFAPYLGCYTVSAIEVQTASGLSSSVMISNNQAPNYQSNGIACYDMGTTCIITKNTVSFYATAGPYLTSNGIHIAIGAVGKVISNTASGNECSAAACGPYYLYQTGGAGIFTLGSGPGTVLSGNTVYDNDIGILAAVSTAAEMLTSNVVQNNRYEGIYLRDGTYVASYNTISGGNIGIAVALDGGLASPVTANLTRNNFRGTFLTAPVQAVAYTGPPYGGSFVEPVNLNFNSFLETITAGSSATPSFVNIP
jgi:parallel beta-helix repeat protein